MRADRVLKNGLVASEDGAAPGDIVIHNGVIAAVLPAGSGAEAAEVTDCSGKLLLPGGVDVHVHANDPGRGDREDFFTATAAAAAGGVTCVVDMPIDSLPPTVSAGAFAAKAAAASARSVVDFALWAGLVEDNVAELPSLAAAGAAGFKAFMVEAGDDFPWVSADTLRRGMRVAAGLGKPVLVHAEDGAAAARAEAACCAEGRQDVDSFLAARSAGIENRAVEEALAAAAEAGCRVHICHASNPEAVRLVAAARKRGVMATVEVTPHHLAFTDADLSRRPHALKCLPPFRNAACREGLWEALGAGAIDMLASDHSPSAPAEKDSSLSLWDAWGGINSIQAGFLYLYSEGVCQRRLPLARFVQLTAANPARLAGLYPAKGVLRPGADADIVVLDPRGSWLWTEDNWLTRHKNTPFLGWSGKGAVDTVLVRGEIVSSGGEIRALPGSGRFLPIGQAGLPAHQHRGGGQCE